MARAHEMLTVQSGDVKLAVYVSGSRRAPPLILVHGYPDSAAVWAPIRARLAKRYRVIAYDVRGAGASDDLTSLQLDDLGAMPNGLPGLQLGMPLHALFQMPTDIDRVVGRRLVATMIANFLRAVLGRRNGVVATNAQEVVLPDVVATILPDGDLLIVADRLLAVVTDGDGFVMFDLLATVMPNESGFVVVDVDVLVLLRVDVDFLLILLVLEAQFVVALALVGLALDRHPRLVPRQLVRRQLQAVVRPPDDERLVRIAIQVDHDHFLPDTRDRHMPPRRTGPVLRDLDPARAVLVVLALAIPRELHLHPAVRVGVDLFAFRTHHGRRLRAVDARARKRLGAPFGVVRHQHRLVAVVRALLRVGTLLRLAGVLHAVMDDADRTPAAVHVLTRVANQVERGARLQACIIAVHPRDTRIATVTTQAVLRKRLAAALVLVAARIVVARVAAALMIEVGALAWVLVRKARALERVVALHLPRGAYVLGIGEGAQAGLRLVAAGRGVIQHRLALLTTEDKQPIAVDQPMTVGLVLEGVEEAFLAQNTFDEVVVGVARLHTVFARQMLVGDTLLVVQRLIVCLEHGRSDLGYAQRLEDAPVGGQLQARQARLDHGGIAGASKPRLALGKR